MCCNDWGYKRVSLGGINIQEASPFFCPPGSLLNIAPDSIWERCQTVPLWSDLVLSPPWLLVLCGDITVHVQVDLIPPWFEVSEWLQQVRHLPEFCFVYKIFGIISGYLDLLVRSLARNGGVLYFSLPDSKLIALKKKSTTRFCAVNSFILVDHFPGSWNCHADASCLLGNKMSVEHSSGTARCPSCGLPSYLDETLMKTCSLGGSIWGKKKPWIFVPVGDYVPDIFMGKNAVFLQSLKILRTGFELLEI